MCPWCYIGKRKFASGLAQVAHAIKSVGGHPTSRSLEDLKATPVRVGMTLLAAMRFAGAKGDPLGELVAVSWS